VVGVELESLSDHALSISVPKLMQYLPTQSYTGPEHCRKGWRFRGLNFVTRGGSFKDGVSG